MQTHEFLRQLADNWFLLAMFTLFVGAVAYAFRPGSRKGHNEAATSIFRNEDRPAEKDTEQ